MFKDLNDLSIQESISCDICIVGSGPAGISVAKKLLGSNVKVILLESGGIEPSVEHNELNKGENLEGQAEYGLATVHHLQKKILKRKLLFQ